MPTTEYCCLEDRLLLRPIKQSELIKTDGGIIDPNVRQKATAKGVVVSIGEGRRAIETGDLIPTVLHEGDTVLYPTSLNHFIAIETEEYGKEEVLLMRESDVILLISKK